MLNKEGIVKVSDGSASKDTMSKSSDGITHNINFTNYNKISNSNSNVAAINKYCARTSKYSHLIVIEMLIKVDTIIVGYYRAYTYFKAMYHILAEYTFPKISTVLS
jgi:hypothetical protein